MAKKRVIKRSDKLIRFIRIEQLDHYLSQGWKVLQQGDEIVTIYWKWYGTTDDNVRTQE